MTGPAHAHAAVPAGSRDARGKARAEVPDPGTHRHLAARELRSGVDKLTDGVCRVRPPSEALPRSGRRDRRGWRTPRHKPPGVPAAEHRRPKTCGLPELPPPPTSCPAAGAAACLEETRPACAGCAVCSLSVCRRCYPQGCEGLARGPCSLCAALESSAGAEAAARAPGPARGLEAQGQWVPPLTKAQRAPRGPTALPSCPEGRRRLGRGGLGLSWPAWAQGAGPGPLRGTWQANGAGMRCSPRPGPRHSGIWGYACPHHILKRRERRGVWGAPSWQVLAPVPACPLSCPEQNPLWVRAPRPATQRERT